MTETAFTFTPEDLEKLKTMSEKGAKMASDSLSTLIAAPIKLHALDINQIQLDDIESVIGGAKSIVSTIVMRVEGDIHGAIVLLYPEDTSFRVADLLARRSADSTTELSELDKSALKESGNIIAGAFLTAVADYTKLKMLESIPDLATDELHSVIESIVSSFSARSESASPAVNLEIDFEMMGKDNNVKAYFLMIMDTESATALMGALEKK